MIALHKIIRVLIDPSILAGVGVVVALLISLLKRRRLATGTLVLSVVWLWFWSMPVVGRMIGSTLEEPYLFRGEAPQLEKYPLVDAIELHGGSMGDSTGIRGRGEMWASADRVWMAARLWKAGKAPVIFVTGGGVKETTAGLLEDFGVPTNAIVFAESPRNTEEEAKFIASAMNKLERRVGVGERNLSSSSAGQHNENAVYHSPAPTLNSNSKPKVLVVTSAWHMKRTMLLYGKYATNIEAIPAPCDFENTLNALCPIDFGCILPSDEALVANRVAIHEWIGIIGYNLKWLVVGE